MTKKDPNQNQSRSVFDQPSEREVEAELKKGPSWFRRKVVEGANLKINEEGLDAKGAAKSSVNINPLYIPRVRFWRAPDVRIMYRALCRSILVIMDPPAPKFEDFDEICKKRGITEKMLQGIERTHKIMALIAFFFMAIALAIGLYVNTFPVWLTSLGAIVISASLYWKYSFRLWQLRKRSLDPSVASPKLFMTGDWYLEAFK